jgi:hypothetical protein
MPRTARADGLNQLLDTQFCVASREQLLCLGLKDNAVQYRVRADGPWQTLLPGVYLGVSGGTNLIQKEMAALLYAGPGSAITGPAALLHHSIRGAANLETIDVLVAVGRQRRSAGFVRLHRTTRLPERTVSCGPLRFALVPRAVADTARQLTSLRDVRAVVADAVQLGRCTVGQLAVELTNGPTQGSAMFRSVLAEVADGIRSTAEGDLRDLIMAAALPTPLFNPSLYEGKAFIAKPDGWWPDAGVAVEADSREWHLSPADWEYTMARHARMAAAGIIVLHFPPRQLRREPAKVAQTIRLALERGRMRPTLPIHTVPCPTVKAGDSVDVAPYPIDSVESHID